MLTRIIPFVFVVLWSTGFIFAKLAMPYAEPFTFLAIRFGLVCVLLLSASLLLQATWPSRRNAMHAVIAGVLVHAVYLGPVFWSIYVGMSAGVSALIVSTQPILTALVAPVLLGERIERRHWLALVFGLIGVAMVLEPKLTEGSADVRLATILASLTGLAGITFGSIYQKRYATGLDLRTAGTLQFLGATMACFLVASLTERWHVQWTGDLILALVWSVLVLSIGAISLLMVMIRDGAIAKVATYFYLVPPTTAIMAWAVFGEQLMAVQLAGMGIACLAVLIAGLARPDVRPAKPVRIRTPLDTGLS